VEANSSHHTKKAWHAICLEYAFLELAQGFRRGVTRHHVLFPDSIEGVGHGMQLWAEVHDN
jgi:hypothetical protein